MLSWRDPYSVLCVRHVTEYYEILLKWLFLQGFDLVNFANQHLTMNLITPKNALYMCMSMEETSKIVNLNTWELVPNLPNPKIFARNYTVPLTSDAGC